MLIIDNSLKESDFCKKTSDFIGSNKLRIFEIDFEFTLFAYYYDDSIHLAVARNDDKQIDSGIWECLKNVGIIYPDIHLDKNAATWINDEQDTLHASIQQKSRRC